MNLDDMNLDDSEDAMPARNKGMIRRAITSTLPPAHRGSGPQAIPSPATLIEARKAHEAAAREPLRYCFGEPLPGRSALDKMKKESHK